MATFFLYYSDTNIPISHVPGDIVLRDCSLSFAAPVGEVFSTANVRSMALENLAVVGAGDAPLVRSWDGTMPGTSVPGTEKPGAAAPGTEQGGDDGQPLGTVAFGEGAWQCPARAACPVPGAAAPGSPTPKLAP